MRSNANLDRISRNSRAGTPRQRFWKYVARSSSECWTWKGAKNAKGYGMLSICHIAYLAHRLSWQIHFGDIPDGLQVLHRCDNPECTNPDHLFLGTHETNQRDKVAKRRHVFGSIVPCSVLTEGDIPIIRKMRSQGFLYRQIGSKFKVSYCVIREVVNGRTWKHVLP